MIFLLDPFLDFLGVARSRGFRGTILEGVCFNTVASYGDTRCLASMSRRGLQTFLTLYHPGIESCDDGKYFNSELTVEASWVLQVQFSFTIAVPANTTPTVLLRLRSHSCLTLRAPTCIGMSGHLCRLRASGVSIVCARFCTSI